MTRSNGHTRIAGVDFLRGISIIVVILMHVNQRAPIEKTIIGSGLHPQVLSCIFKNGYLGVIIFFVISGFLITSSSLKRWGDLHNLDIKKFYFNRFARIAPCLLCILGILSLLHLLGISGFVIDPQKSTLARAAFSALTFHLNWLEAQRGYLPGSWDVLWSLSVEEMFYLIFPVACVLLKKQLSLIIFMLIFIVLGPFARTLIANEIWQDHSYLSCMDGIALGCLTALFAAKYEPTPKILRGITWVGVTLFIISMVFKRQIFQLGLSNIGLNVTLLEVATALLIISINARINQAANWFTLPFQWFGRNSYEVYLTHMILITMLEGTWLMDKDGSHYLILGFAVILISSGILGDFLNRFFSEPANQWIRTRRVRLYPNLSSQKHDQL